MRLLRWLDTVMEFARLHKADRASERRTESPHFDPMQLRR